MGMAISATSARGHSTPARPANFGQLNSAIARGDLTSAQQAFVAINEAAAPAAMAAQAKGSLEAVGNAIASGDVEAAKQSLADLRRGHIPQPEAVPAPEVATLPVTGLPVTGPQPGAIANPVDAASTQTILALLTGSGSTVSTIA